MGRLDPENNHSVGARTSSAEFYVDALPQVGKIHAADALGRNYQHKNTHRGRGND